MATAAPKVGAPGAPLELGRHANPPFDARKLSVGSHYGGPVVRQRGYITQAIPREGYKHYGVNFLHNPSTISISHGLDESLNTDPNAHDLNDVTRPMPVTTQSSIEFALLFDRTFEINDPAYEGQEVHTQGVYVDMAAFYRMLGMLQPASVTSEGSKGEEGYTQSMVVDKGAAPNGGGAKAPTLTAPMQYVSTNLYLGGPLSYFGIISGFSVTISHWNVNMVPVRCAINVGFMILPEALMEVQDTAEKAATNQRNFNQPYVRAPSTSDGKRRTSVFETDYQPAIDAGGQFTSKPQSGFGGR